MRWMTPFVRWFCFRGLKAQYRSRRRVGRWPATRPASLKVAAEYECGPHPTLSGVNCVDFLLFLRDLYVCDL